MPKDNRVKGCSNTECERYIRRFKYKSTENYCSLCGNKLILVCKDCFRKIEDIDFRHKTCASCEAKKEDSKEKAFQNVGKVVGVVGAFALNALNKKR